MSNINEERLRKFREMGIPQPMAPVDPSMLKGPVKNIEFAAKLAAIKNGAIKETVDVFLEKEKGPIGFVPLETSKKSKPVNGQTKPIISETIKSLPTSGPSFDAYEKALYGDNTPTSNTYETASSGRGYSSNIGNENGNDFLTSIKTRLAEKAARASQSPNQKILTENTSIPSGYKLIQENELREAITLISTDVCKDLMKKFMEDFSTSKPGLIKESEKIKKAEIIQKDIVKIEGKFFKIVPVTIKKK